MKPSRGDAKSVGDKFYFTGLPCVNGHISKRQTSNGCCYTCSQVRNKEYLSRNKEKRKQYREENKNRIRENARQYSLKNKKKRERYNAKNKDAIRAREKKYIAKNEDRIKSYKKKYYEENRDKYLEYSRKRYAIVKDDVDFRLKKVMRQNLRRLMIDPSRKSSTPQMMGYNSQKLRNHIESLFTDGMTWENYGEWHIDHITPINWFLKNGIKEASIINALTNLQPLWSSDNLSKGARHA